MKNHLHTSMGTVGELRYLSPSRMENKIYQYGSGDIGELK
jgi:hypothetical protein